jgi:chromosome segregation ATPase
MWASQGGPIIGEIKNGKKYPFGTVSATQYEEDMAALNTEISGLNSAVVACQGTLSGLQSALDTLSGQYGATVPGLSQAVSDIRVQVGEVNAALTAATQSLTAAISAVDIKADNIDESCGQRINALDSRITTLAAKEAGDVETLTGRLDTAASDLRSTQITVRDHTTSINALTGRMTAAEGNIQGLDLTLREHSSEISSQGETIGILSSDLGAVTDLATATSATTAANSEAITGIRDAITQMRASITANAQAINAFNAAITELTSTQNVDRATLTARIAAAETSISALAQTVEGYNTTLSNQIAGLRASVTANSQDIAVIQNTLQIQGLAIEAAEERCTAVEGRMNAQEVGMATLRQQLLNSVMNIENEIEQVVTDKAAIKANLAALTSEVSAYEADVNATLSEYNTRIARLEDSTPLEIISFTASPDVCELGGSENVVLSWNVQGSIESITINGDPVSGTSKTIPNVRENTSFTLNAVDTRGNVARKTISVNFVNHIFWGTSPNAEATEGTLKALDFTELSDVRARDIHVSPDNEYIYYGYPKRLGTSEFRVNGFTGGFENPAIVSVDNHAGYDEDYYIYRSANKLNSTFEVHII